jgi:hypothetical protein
MACGVVSVSLCGVVSSVCVRVYGTGAPPQVALTAWPTYYVLRSIILIDSPHPHRDGCGGMAAGLRVVRERCSNRRRGADVI